MPTEENQPKLSKAEKAAAHLAQLHRDRESLFDAQANLGRVRRLHKAARKDPAVAEILDQNIAQGEIITQLRESLTTGDARNLQLVEKLGAADATITDLNTKVSAAKGDLAEQAKTIEALNGVIASRDQAAVSLKEEVSRLAKSRDEANSKLEQCAQVLDENAAKIAALESKLAAASASESESKPVKSSTKKT
ncbi:hypothetical protein [Oleiharenicola lentus]|uniref:hypothetical protein n=1 Tax=Oleiharenicola lentus TaxID=2508720 RepID=UPI003F672E61